MFGDSKMRQRDLFVGTRATLLCVKQVLIASSLALLLWLLLANKVAVADKIVIDGIQHEDVVISSSESLYYVSFPKLGTTVSVRKSDISDEDILIDSSGEERSALFAEWKLANTRVKEQREEVKRKRELEALEKERLRVLAEQEKKEADEILAREQIRLEKQELGIRAAQVLAGEPEKYSENLRQAEKAETSALAAELDELENELKSILLKSSDPSKAVVPDRIKKRVQELGEMGQEKAKLNSRAESEPGYSLEARKSAMVTVLMDQGASRSEAVATVEDMVKNDMLPDPPVSGSKDNENPKYVYSNSVRRAAALETLIESGWERSDAEIGVENMKQDDNVVKEKKDPVSSNSVEIETSTADHSKRSFSSEREPVDKSIEREVDSKGSFTSERDPVDKGIEQEVEANWVPRPGGLTKEESAWVARDIRSAKSWEELEEVIRFHDENGR